ELETSLGIGPRAADGSVFLTVEGIDGPTSGESHAMRPGGKDRSILHRFAEMVENTSVHNSPLLQSNHHLDSVFSGRRSFTEHRLGYVAVRDNARCPTVIPVDRCAESI